MNGLNNADKGIYMGVKHKLSIPKNRLRFMIYSRIQLLISNCDQIMYKCLVRRLNDFHGCIWGYKIMSFENLNGRINCVL